MALRNDSRSGSAGSGSRRHRQSSSRGGERIRLDLDAVPPARLRSLVQELLAENHEELSIPDAVQIADELASNALRHGAAPRNCTITLSAGPRLRIEVADASPIDPRFRSADETGGLGLVLVDQMSSGWGVIHRGGRKIVWAELAAEQRGTGPPLCTELHSTSRIN
ncbi:ATP-binding protein [Nocardia wallacei]|uniref:ATP-binding protein n=1 Tax=Nocardia wallacei TaxID=480035 RepID=UPI0024551A53|nr:ATP-binding protein [Nocardia wallacei]